MTNTNVIPTDAATQRLIDEAMAMPAALTHPLYTGADLGIDTLEFDVHVVASRWSVDGEALALCGEELIDMAHGRRADLPMCWQCADVLDGVA